MADRSPSENVKTVKNSLLTGAGATFPFESFTHLSLLAPVETEFQSSLVEGT